MTSLVIYMGGRSCVYVWDDDVFLTSLRWDPDSVEIWDPRPTGSVGGVGVNEGRERKGERDGTIY